MSSEDLSTVTSEDLIKELFSRYPKMVILRENKAKVGDMDEMLYDYEGGITNAIGLVKRGESAFLELASINRVNPEEQR